MNEGKKTVFDTSMMLYIFQCVRSFYYYDIFWRACKSGEGKYEHLSTKVSKAEIKYFTLVQSTVEYFMRVFQIDLSRNHTTFGYLLTILYLTNNFYGYYWAEKQINYIPFSYLVN